MANSNLRLFVEKGWIKLLSYLLWSGVMVIVGYGLWRYHAEILTYLRQANFSHLMEAFGFYCLAIPCLIIGWHAIMRTFAPQIDWQMNTLIYLSTLALRRLPGTLWYIGGRMTFYQKLGVNQIKIAAASGVELVITLASGCVMGLAFLLFGIQLPPIMIVLLAAAALVCCFLIWPPILEKFMRWIKRPLDEKPKLWETLTAFFAFLSVWFFTGLAVAQMVSAFQPLHQREILIILSAWPISGVAGLLTFFLPSSFGLTEITLATFLSGIIPLPLAGFLVIFLRLATTSIELIISLGFYPAIRRSFNI